MNADGIRAERPVITYYEPSKEKEQSDVALEAPLTVVVFDPDAAKDSRSRVTVALETTGGSTVNVDCQISMAHVPGQRRPGNARSDLEWALEQGRFVGQVMIQLGSKDSPNTIPLGPTMPRNLLGRAYQPGAEEGGEDEPTEEDDEVL